MNNDTLELLARMSDEWNQQAAALVDLAVAAVMVRAGMTVASFNADELANVLEQWTIEREITSVETGERWTLTIKPKSDQTHKGQMEFDHD